MSKRRQNRIDFYNMLVSSPEEDFHDWCEELVEDFLEKRAYLILDYYSAFKHIYDYFKSSYISEDIRKFYCEFKDDNNDMIITVKYNNYKIDNSFIKDINNYFLPTECDDYLDFELIYDSEKDKTIKLVFSKG